MSMDIIILQKNMESVLQIFPLVLGKKFLDGMINLGRDGKYAGYLWEDM